MKRTQVCIFMIIFISLQLNGQADTLRSKSLASIMELIYVQKDSADAIALSNYLTERARLAKDSSSVSWGHYGNYLFRSPPENLPYLDSLVYSTKGLNNDEELFALTTNANYYFIEAQDYNKALSYDLEARWISLKTKNEYYIRMTTASMASIKFMTGEFSESLALLHRYRKMRPEDSLALYFNIANCHFRLKNSDSLSYYSALGIRESLKKRDTFNYDSFLRLNGVSHYLRGNLRRSLDSLKKARDLAIDTINLGSSYYYTALAHEAIGNPDSTLFYFGKIASLDREPEVYFPEIKNVWFRLYKDALKDDDEEKQLTYIEKFMDADSILESESNGLLSMVDKNYDLPLFEERRAQLLAARTTKRNLTFLVIALSVLLIFSVVFFLGRYFHHKKRLKDAIGNPETYLKTMDGNKKSRQKRNDLPVELTEQLDRFLREFENARHFLDPTLSLQKLSAAAETNTTYLSGYLNTNHGGYSDYINSRRVHFAFADMPGNPKISIYTLEHIAKLYGFTSLRAFNRAFEKFLKIKPRDYLDQIKRRGRGSN